jgi:hypothetical protein
MTDGLGKILRANAKKVLSSAKKGKKVKASTKIKKAAGQAMDKAGKAIENFSLEAVDEAVGKGMEKVASATKNASAKAKKAGNWIKNNKGKLAVGGAVAGAGAYAYDKHEKDKTISSIKEKPASERTAQEKRLLRLMQEEDE